MILLVAVLAGLQAMAQPLPPAVIQLAAVRRHVNQELDRSAAMMCLETIERTRWDAKGQRRQSDRLQVEVALAGNREWFAWPGDEAFTRETPAEIAGGGLGSSGELFSHLRSVFRSPGASIRPAASGAAGRHLVYDFTVPMLGSEYRIAGLTGQASVSTAGRLWVDAQTFDVVRLEARAVDVPVQTGLREVTSHIDYTRMQIGGGQTRLAPQRAVLAIVDLAGAVNRNHIEFSHCREFGATSEVSFDSATERPTQQPIAVPAAFKTRLPPRTVIRTRLAAGEPVSLAQLHAGAAIEATLVDAIRQRGQEIAPAGAVVSGRLRWLEKREKEWMIGVELHTIRAGSTGIRFLAGLTAVRDPGGVNVRLPVPRQRERVELPAQRLGDFGTRVTYAETETIELLRLPGVGLFLLPAGAMDMPRGLELTWITE
ncbi:MAG: hypothetical protein IT162_09435 [Bryobacterales bacterium]|nr:hypothetical protein [Bryobacterales bacterium]